MIRAFFHVHKNLYFPLRLRESIRLRLVQHCVRQYSKGWMESQNDFTRLTQSYLASGKFYVLLLKPSLIIFLRS